MNTETIENVLHEILNEQKETGKLNKQLISKMENISCQMEKLEKKTNKSEVPSSNDDIKSLQEIIVDGISSIKQTVAAQQRNSISEKRIIIFPEFRSPECFRLLFNCIIYLTIATYGFLIIKVVVAYWCK